MKMTLAELIEELMDNYDLDTPVNEYSIVMDGATVQAVLVRLEPQDQEARKR